ncbi:MAG: M23 family metallopeptidase [Deltaproteobacteria bacterium]|nr:M23 family metallopeptidase [Deltaproteobacteria bacterium]
MPPLLIAGTIRLMSLTTPPRFGKSAHPALWAALALVALGVLGWLLLGNMDYDEPVVILKTPVEAVGAKTALTLEAGDETSGLRDVKVTFSQDGHEKVILEKNFPPGGAPGEKVEIPVVLEPKALGFKEGKATLTATVRDRSWQNLFQGRTARLTQDVVIDLVPIRLSFEAVSHLLHAGGTGCISYHLNKAAKESGVLVGGQFYRGYANPRGGQGEYVVLFPVPQEGPAATQVELVARPGVGQEIKQPVSLKVKPRKWRHDKLNLPDDFLRKVAATIPGPNPSDLLGNYLWANRELRRQNHEKFHQVCSQSSPTPLWSGAFKRYVGKPMARFGDRRTYMYQRKDVDQQTHLGEDLASLINSPVPAANNGIVVLAENVGIYGNTVMIDHGLGVFSGYSHLSQIDVKVGDKVTKGQVVGKTGTTGLAGGDHLHFDMSIQGEFVDPLEWWDPHWLRDQVEKVWGKAATPATATAAESAPQAAKETRGKKKAGKGKTRSKKAKQQ